MMKSPSCKYTYLNIYYMSNTDIISQNLENIAEWLKSMKQEEEEKPKRKMESRLGSLREKILIRKIIREGPSQ